MGARQLRSQARSDGVQVCRSEVGSKYDGPLRDPPQPADPQVRRLEARLEVHRNRRASHPSQREQSVVLPDEQLARQDHS